MVGDWNFLVNASEMIETKAALHDCTSARQRRDVFPDFLVPSWLHYHYTTAPHVHKCDIVTVCKLHIISSLAS